MPPSPRIAVPFVTTATVFEMFVYARASEGSSRIDRQTRATPGV